MPALHAEPGQLSARLVVGLCPARRQAVEPEPGGPAVEGGVQPGRQPHPDGLQLPGVLRCNVALESRALNEPSRTALLVKCPTDDVSAGPTGGHGVAEDGAVAVGGHLGHLWVGRVRTRASNEPS